MAEWLTTEELAAELQVPVGTVRYWRVKGTGPEAKRFGKLLRYSREAVDQWCARRPA